MRRIPSLVLGSSSFCAPDWTAGRPAPSFGLLSVWRIPFVLSVFCVLCFPCDTFPWGFVPQACIRWCAAPSGPTGNNRADPFAQAQTRALTRYLRPRLVRCKPRRSLSALPPARPYSHPPTLLCLPSYRGVRPAGARVHAVEANSATFVRLGVNVRPSPTPHLRLFTPCGRVLAPAQCSHPPTGTCSSRA